MEGAFLNCGIAREKINQPEHTTGYSQNKGTDKLQRKASLRQTGPSLPDIGGRVEGKGAISAPEMASPPTLQRGLQFLSKDSLRFWMVDFCRREGRGKRPAPENKHKALDPDRHVQKLRLGPRRGKCMPHLGRVHLLSSWLPEPLRPGKAQNTGATESAFLWGTQKLEPHTMQGMLPIEQPGA